MGTPEARISRRVRALLAERDISGAELARRLELSQSYVSRRLRGAVPWRAHDLAVIASVLDVPVESLLAHADTNGAAA